MSIRVRRSLTALFAAGALVTAAAPAAQAGLLTASANDCASESLSQVFAPWADPASYTLAPGGNFESTPAGWSLGGASVVAGNESYRVGAATDAASLAIRDGQTVTTSSVCVGLDHPTIRYFAKQTGGSPVSGHIDVEVLFEDATGNVMSAPMGAAGAGSSWAPSTVQVVGPALIAGLPGDKTAVAFRFSAHNGDFQVDDLYVDPWSMK